MIDLFDSQIQAVLIAALIALVGWLIKFGISKQIETMEKDFKIHRAENAGYTQRIEAILESIKNDVQGVDSRISNLESAMFVKRKTKKRKVDNGN